MRREYPGLKIKFFSEDKNSLSPTEKFLILRYRKNLNIHTKEIIQIAAAWKMALENGGLPFGSCIAKYHGYDSLYIRIKFSRILIRFPFYPDLSHNRLVLLLGFAKPDPYNPGGKIAREVKRKLEEAQKYYEIYHLDNQKFKTSKKIKEIMCQYYEKKYY